ncbi:type II toxin-antitoxin system RelE/ParE family toxin [Mycobacterium tuberculosis]|uniref:type II toxin-antitoxin system RelE/ParE family toxin n=1 Tax=Mycobacterium tuberculosis TaxID=1773 RepID=UPI001F3A5027|nr:type II toxin-antitoxin system RelE/ParE family toxin [Mycobacterium tuberculosis]
MASVTGAIDLLEMEGADVGPPGGRQSERLNVHNMKELRPAGTSIRILFAFDPARQAILLLAVTRQATGNAGTTTTFQSLTSAPRTGWRASTEVDDHGPQLA